MSENPNDLFRLIFLLSQTPAAAPSLRHGPFRADGNYDHGVALLERRTLPSDYDSKAGASGWMGQEPIGGLFSELKARHRDGTDEP
jgi:hypothetical protein